MLFLKWQKIIFHNYVGIVSNIYKTKSDFAPIELVTMTLTVTTRDILPFPTSPHKKSEAFVSLG